MQLYAVVSIVSIALVVSIVSVVSIVPVVSIACSCMQLYAVVSVAWGLHEDLRVVKRIKTRVSFQHTIPTHSTHENFFCYLLLPTVIRSFVRRSFYSSVKIFVSLRISRQDHSRLQSCDSSACLSYFFGGL